MKYFTPERLVRLQDHSDERQFLAALDEWEDALSRYRQQLNTIQRELCLIPQRTPKSVREFLKFFTDTSLHDARVLDMTWQTPRRYRIALHPEYQSGCLVVLNYSLEQPPPIEFGVLPEQLRSEPICWLYDELTLESGESTGIQLLRHNILLSDGSEVKLRFADVAVERRVPLVPAVPAEPGSP